MSLFIKEKELPIINYLKNYPTNTILEPHLCNIDQYGAKIWIISLLLSSHGGFCQSIFFNVI